MPRDKNNEIKSLLQPKSFTQGSELKTNQLIPVSGYEKQLHISNEGIVTQGGGFVYYEDDRGNLINVVMTDNNDMIHSVVKTIERIKFNPTQKESPGTPGPTTNDGTPTY